MMNHSKTVNELCTADDRYRPVIMWFWNDDIEESEVRRQIKEFKNANMCEFFVHPMYYLGIEYLSDRFFELIKIAVDEASKQNMKFWIYDEYNWPSGVAGGYILRDHPSLRAKALCCIKKDILQGQKVTLPLESQVIAAFILYDGTYKQLDLECTVNNNNELIWENLETCSVCLVVFYEAIREGKILAGCRWSPFSWNQEGYLDMCNPDGVEEFIKYTHERYHTKIGEEFGLTVKGVFTDEPCLGSSIPLKEKNIPWTRDILRRFKEEKGYDLSDRLIELLLPMNKYEKTRWDFWDVISKEFSDVYFKRIARWCDNHLLKFTGHIYGEESLFASLLQSGSIFRSLKHFHIPGIDSVLSKRYIERDDFNVPGKLVSSIGHQLGKHRILCEAYTGSGWDCTLEDMKRIFNRLAVLGINMLQMMGAYYSIKGAMKQLPAGYPPSHSFQRPLWKHYGDFSDYVSRVCSTLSKGKHLSNIAVLYPISSSWSECDFSLELVQVSYAPNKHSILTIDYTIKSTVNALLAIGRGFDFVFEDMLEEAIVEDGKLIVGEESFSALILPSVTTLTKGCMDTINRFASSGGTLVFINYLPDKSPDSENIQEWSTKLTGHDPSAIRNEVNELFNKEKEITRTDEGGCHVIASKHKGRINYELAKILDEKLSLINQHISLNKISENLYITGRELEDGSKLFFVVNDTNEYIEEDFYLCQNGVVHIVNLEKGETERLCYVKKEVPLTIKLHSYDSTLIYMENSESREISPPMLCGSTESFKTLEVLDDTWRFEVPKGNYMKLNWNVTNDTQNWLPSVEGRFPGGAGFYKGTKYWAKTEFEVLCEPLDMSIVMDYEDDIEVWVNGEEIVLAGQEQVWDKDNMIYNFVSKEGHNELRFKASIPNWTGPHILPFTALRGKFCVDDNMNIKRASGEITTGSWSEQGYPFYSGAGIYKCSVNITDDIIKTPANFKEIRLYITELHAGATVFINGINVGSSSWEPHVFNISNYICFGVNEIAIEIVNTMMNLFVSPVPSGLLGKVIMQIRQ